MRAVTIREFGSPQVLIEREAAEPEAGEGEVLIDVEYANVTFVETQVRAGRPPHPSMLPTLPTILGNGVGGVLARTYPGVNAAIGGRRVVASLGGHGGYAERAVARVEQLVEVPDRMPMRDAVALLADGRTALGLVGRAEVQSGDVVLVEAAAGGVGTLLVQLAHTLGARVVALAGGQRKVTVATELGCDVAFNYLDTDWERQVRSAVETVDVVFDGVGGEIGRSAFTLLRAGGRFCPFGMSSGTFAPVSAELAAERGITVLRPTASNPADLLKLTRAGLDEADRGLLQPLIGQEFALRDAAAAHAAIEARTTIGKTLLTVPRPRGATTDDPSRRP